MIDIVLPGLPGEPALWVDLCDPTPEDFDTLVADYGLHPASLRACMEPMHLPKHERVGDATFLIIRVYVEENGGAADDVRRMTSKIALFLGDRFLITVHRHPLSFLEPIHARFRAMPPQPVYLQVALLELLLAGIETFHAPLEAAELRVHALEAAVLGEDASDVSDRSWRSAFRTRVRLQTIKRLLWHTENALSKFVPKSSENLPLAHDVRERIASLSFFAESLENDLAQLLDVQLALASQKTGEVMRVLTLFSAFFLPLTFIVGVYGMNFEFMPEFKWRYGYPMVLAVIALTVAGIYFWFRRRGWLTRNP